MLRLTALLALVYTVWGQGEKCCAPDIWEGEIHVHAGYVMDGAPRMAFQLDFAAQDFQTKEKAYFHESHYPDGTSRSFRTIENYNTKKSYFIQDNECHVTDLTGEFEKDCVPEDATYSGAIYYGNTEHRLNAEVFFMIHHNEGGEEVGRSLFTVATEGCIPLETTSYHYTDSKNSYMTGGTYANIRPEISDREIFVPPSSCMAGDIPEYVQELPGYQMFKKVF